jgi:hypothetical protein
VVAPVVFVAIVAVLTVHEWNFLHRLGWKLWGKTDVPWPSSTALGSWGWLQVLNFIQLGLAILGLTLAMRAVLPPGRAARVGRWALTVTGLAVVALAFKTDPTSTIKTWHGGIHAIAFLVLVLSALVAMFAIWRSRWPGLSRASLALATVALASTIVSFIWASASTVIGGISLLALLVWTMLVALAVRAAAR